MGASSDITRCPSPRPTRSISCWGLPATGRWARVPAVRFSVTAKIFAAFVLLLVAFGGVSVHGILQLRGTHEQLQAINHGYLRFFVAVKELQLYQGYLRNAFDLEAEH